MKKIYSLFCFLFLSSTLLFATHNKGGEITYEAVGNFTYKITITTYTKLCPVCPDRDILDSVYWGDGNRETVLRFDFMDLSDSIRLNHFIAYHTYGGEGIYRIYFIDPNRTEGIANIPNSVIVPFCVESYLVAFDQSLYCVNNSVQSQVVPIFTGKVGEPFIHNPAFADPDGDSLSFELVFPMMALDTPVPGYTFPQGLTINSISGEIRWNLPMTQGDYCIVVKIKEWRQGYMVGYVLRDFQITLSAAISDTSNVFAPLTFPQDATGNYFVSVNPGDTVNIHAVYYGSIPNPFINSYGEALLYFNPSVQYSSGSGTAVADLIWIPDIVNSRPHPYIFTFRGASTILQTDLTVLVYVNGTSSMCPPFPFIGFEELKGNSSEVIISPNPAANELVVQGSELGSKNEIEIYDVMGEKLFKSQLSIINHQLSIDVSHLSSGIYFVKVKTDKGISAAKFVKE